MPDMLWGNLRRIFTIQLLYQEKNICYDINKQKNDHFFLLVPAQQNDEDLSRLFFFNLLEY